MAGPKYCGDLGDNEQERARWSVDSASVAIGRLVDISIAGSQSSPDANAQIASETSERSERDALMD